MSVKIAGVSIEDLVVEVQVAGPQGAAGPASVSVADSSSINLTLSNQGALSADAIFGIIGGTVAEGNDTRFDWLTPVPFANLPAAASNTGKVRSTDFNNGFVLVRSNGTRWIPVLPIVLLNLVSENGETIGPSVTAETAVGNNVPIPIGLIAQGDSLLFEGHFTKGGTPTGTNYIRVRLGTSETPASNAEVFQIGSTSSNVNNGFMRRASVLSNTRTYQNGIGAVEILTTNAPRVVTVSDLSTSLSQLAVTIQAGGSTESTTWRSFRVTLIPGG